MPKPRSSPATSRSTAYRRAREAALQALYQWHMTALPAAEIKQQFFGDKYYKGIDDGLFARLVDGVVERHEALDASLCRWADRSFEEIGPVETAILRIAAYELRHCPAVPVRVVINEAVNLAHTFGAEQSHRYINGVIDSAAHVWRAGEFQP